MWDSTFTIRAEGPSYAGKIVRSTLGDVNSEAADSAALLTSELVADVMIDVGADPQLFIDSREGYIYVEVRATDSMHRHVEQLRTRQRTSALLNAVASSWGVDSCDDGSAVWFALSF